MDILKRIEIKGYRSIKSAEIELGALNILIGANGAGKSNFVSFFKMLNELRADRLQQYIGTSGRAQALLHFGPKVTLQLEGRLEFEVHGRRNATNWYNMRLFHASGDTLVFAEETLGFQEAGFHTPKMTPLGAGHQESRIGDEANKGDPTAKSIRFLLDRCRAYHFHDTSPTARVRQYCYINDNDWLMPDAGNLAAMLFAYLQTATVVYNRIISTIRKIMPEFDDFELAPSRLNANDIMLNWRKVGSDYLFGPHQISDGSLRAMAICTLFLQPEANLPKVIVLDEPELGLHPHALAIVAGLIRAASTRTQVIAATQSQSLLDFFELSEIITVETHEGQSVFHRLEPDVLRDWLEDYSIGELWRRNVLGGGPLP